MSESSDPTELPLDSAAAELLPQLVADLRTGLLSTAKRLTPGGIVGEDELVAAYKQLQFPTADSLRFADAQIIISHALRENRTIEWVSYAMAVVLFVFGLVLLTVGALNGDPALRVGCLVSGSLVELLILIPFRFAINSRRHNIALRMLGLIINRVDDPQKLAPLLKDTFLCVVLGEGTLRTKKP